MINIFKRAETTGKVAYSYNFETDIATFADIKIHRDAIDKIVDRLVDDWIEQYGADLLEQITPQEVEKAVKKNLAKRVLKA